MERLLLHRLPRERLDDAHSRDVLGERGGDEAEPLSDVPVGAVGAAAEPGRRNRHQRQHRQGGERELDVEEEENDRRPEEEQRVLDEARDPVGDELVECLDVVRDPADDHACPVALVEAERQPRELGEELVPQIGEHALPRPAGQIGVHGREDERGDRSAEEDHDDQGQPGEVLVLDSLVDRQLRQVRRCEGDERVGEKRREREDRPTLVRQRQPAENAETPPGAPPRPVAHIAASFLREMPSGLPDLHALSFRSP